MTWMCARGPGRGLLLRGLAPLLVVAGALLGLAVPRSVAAQGTLSQLQTDVDQIARRARPSVVTVFAQTMPREPRAAGESGTATQSMRVHTRVGSGVAIDESLILTTASVVLGANRVVVRTANGIQVEAEMVGMDPIFNVALLRGAELEVIPSLYEGFCLPMVEAMACGVPTIASNTSCLPEISGGALRYFDPCSVEDLAVCMEETLRSHDLRAELAGQGNERAQRFSWELCAGETLGVLEQVADTLDVRSRAAGVAL